MFILYDFYLFLHLTFQEILQSIITGFIYISSEPHTKANGSYIKDKQSEAKIFENFVKIRFQEISKQLIFDN